MLKVRTGTLAVAFVMLAALPATPPAAAQADVTVYEGARLIVGDGSEPIQDAAFVVRGTRFEAVGRAGDVAVPAGAARVDLSGHTVIPALVDTHVHLSREREALVEERAARHAEGRAGGAAVGGGAQRQAYGGGRQGAGDCAVRAGRTPMPGHERAVMQGYV